MLDLTIWHATQEALVQDDVQSWRKEIDEDGSNTYIFHGYVPEPGDADRTNIFKPGGFLGTSEKCILIWEASDINADELVDFIDSMEKRRDMTYHVGLIRTSGTDFVEDVYEYEPEEFDYALADSEDPVNWADQYLQQWCNARLADDAYDYLNIVAMTDYMMVADTVSSLYKFLGAASEQDDEREISKEQIASALKGFGEASFFDILKAMDAGDVENATNLSLRMEPHSVHGLITNLRNKMLLAGMRDGGMKVNVAREAFRDHAAEQKEIEAKKQKLISKGKDFSDDDFDNIVKYRMSEKQAKYLYDSMPRYSSQETGIIWNIIAKADMEAKSGQLSGTSVLEFASTVALVNKAAKSRRKSRR